jgi:hypothetical protein
MGASIPEFPELTKQIPGHAAHYRQRNGKSSPGHDQRRRKCKNFRQAHCHPKIAKQDMFGPDLRGDFK